MPASALFSIPILFAFLFCVLCADDSHRKGNDFLYGLFVFGCGMAFMLELVVLLPVFAPGIAEVFLRALTEVL